MHGKPQKSRKHKKLKAIDPFNFKAIEERRQQNSRNLAPKTYEQEIPRAFKEIFLTNRKEAQTLNNGPSTSKVKKQKNSQESEEFVKYKWENEQQFLRRINKETSNFVNDQLVKIKYDISAEQKDNKEDDEATSEQKDKQSKHNSDHPSRKIRKKRKLDDDMLNQKDFVAFGERNDMPPNLAPFIGKLAKKQPTKRSLLLDGVASQPQESHVPFPSKKNYLDDGTIKCSDVTKTKMLQQERNKIIEVYRSAKRKKVSS